MTKQQKTKIEDFIRNNHLTFVEGKRNTDSVALSGYALSLGLKKHHDLEKVIDVLCPTADWEYNKELERVFTFASANNYENWWGTQEAKNSYKF